MKKITLLFFVAILLISVKLIFFYPANKDVRFKLQLIEDEVAKRGYKTNWIVISGKRSVWYNNLLSNSADNSHHLRGNAIDIYVFDIDGDGKFGKSDIRILQTANDYVENNYPRLNGAFGTYTTKGYFSKHMVHFDIGGLKVKYNK